MTDLERAVALLHEDPARTCAFVCGEEHFVRTERGVNPLLTLARKGKFLKNFSCADRVVGKAAALLYAFLGAKEVYADVLSASAEVVFVSQKIKYVYQNFAQNIINRQGTGLCPMELATKDISDPAEAVEAIERALAALKRPS